MRLLFDDNMQILHNYVRDKYANMTELKYLRQSKKMTQKDAADRIGISLRSYITYENDESKTGSLKYRMLLKEIKEMNRVDEEHGILELEEIRRITAEVLRDYPAELCVLFGSYAKGTASEYSDVDLLVLSDVSGLQFYGMAERLRESLHKKVDLLDFKQLADNEELLKEILKTGVRIYGPEER